MESRLKERLTGAAILVALIVLIVPEVFHDRRSAPTPTGVTAAAPAGASAAPTRSYTIELTPQPPPAVQPPAPAVAEPVAAAPAAPAAPAAATLPTSPTAHAPVSEGPEKARVAAVSSSHARGGWTVQLGLFAKAANAEHLARTAQSHGIAVQISRFGPRGLYRVAVAGIADRAAAEQLSHRLHGAGLPAAILVPRSR